MATTPTQVAEAFEQTGCAWILTDPHKDKMLAAVAKEIDELIREYQQRFGVTPEPFKLLEKNPVKAAAFFQAFTGPPHSLDARLLIWDLLRGAEILSVDFSYQRRMNLRFEVTTTSPDGEIHVFKPESVWDFRLLRHISVLGINEDVVLDGYYGSRHPK